MCFLRYPHQYFYSFISKASDEQKGTLSMTRLQLHPDPNMDTDNRLGKLEPESPQSPGAESQMSFNVYDAKISGRDSFLGALPSSASTIGFWSDHHSKGKMDNFTVRAYSKRIRQLTLFLAVFIIVSMVMTALFVWRMSYYKLEDKTDEKRHLEQVRFQTIALHRFQTWIFILISQS